MQRKTTMKKKKKKKEKNPKKETEKQPVASLFGELDTEQRCSTSGITSTGAETFIIHKLHAWVM